MEIVAIVGYLIGVFAISFHGSYWLAKRKANKKDADFNKVYNWMKRVDNKP